MLLLLIFLAGNPNYSWLSESSQTTLSQAIQPPARYRRLPATDNSFTIWLRGLPVREDKTVYLHNGQPKANQRAQHAVIAIDTGTRDLQQCADAVMRLRAEYLFASGQQEAISFNFTSGHPARWSDWRDGQRPVVKGNRVTWSAKAEKDSSYRNFRRYLNIVFSYAGTYSLKRELHKVENPKHIQPGDVFIQGGFPGHGVLVVDVVENDKGERAFLLAQSYMPAQDIHVLRNPSAAGPWYTSRSSGKLITPEWSFTYEDLHRW